MLKNYLKLAVKVLARRKFFTFVSLFGISFTLVVLLVVTALLDTLLAPLPPEMRQDRMLGIYCAVHVRAEHIADDRRRRLQAARRLHARPPGVERMSIVEQPSSVVSYLNGARVEVVPEAHRRRVLADPRFDFVEGGPYTTADDRDAHRMVAVINEATRTKFFGDGAAGGRPDDRVGRPAVPGRSASCATCRNSASCRSPTSGCPIRRERPTTTGARSWAASWARSWRAAAPTSPSHRRRGADRGCRSVEPADDPKTYTSRGARSKRYSTRPRASCWPAQSAGRDPRARDCWLVLLIAGVALHAAAGGQLVNLNVSRIMERASEIGVRKAFGASSLGHWWPVHRREHRADADRRRHRVPARGRGCCGS